ncbi:hypothetical protein F7725_028254 [Dissostichus mawsoni]|uniref:Uncharacterized protein n=1 Tax=Dissostichus mawsoni TaxID=36200 RepID=A0A7J5XF61_DISMA|nr:hypothetical protein F7725_028254 [Dissostichus mawsoni]
MLKSGSEASSWCRELTDSCWLLCRRWPCVGFTYRFRVFTFNMSNVHSELTPRQRELLKIRRDSDTKAAELVKMEKMLQQTKDLLDRKTESCSDSMDLQENMVKGELVGTLDHLQELRNVLRRSQQKAEERKAAMEKLAAGLRTCFSVLWKRSER